MKNFRKSNLKTDEQIKDLPKFGGKEKRYGQKFNPATFKTQHKG